MSNGTTGLPAELERQALDLAPVMIRDLDGTIRLWTQGCQRLYGYSRVEAVGERSHRLLRTAFPRPLAEIDAELLERGEWTGELVHRRRDDEIMTVASSWSLCRNGNGDPIAVTEVNNDVTQQKRDEEARLRLAAIVEFSEDAIISKSLDGTVTSWNKAAEAMFGYAAAEIVGQPIGVLFPPDRLAEEAFILEQMRRGERIDHYETVRRRKDGTEIQVSLTVSPIRDVGGAVAGISKIARDITGRKRMQARLDELRAELLHVSRLSTMGQMASTLAHELNQPLTAATNYLSALRRVAAGPAADAKQMMEIATRAAEQTARAGDVIRRLRQFVSTGETDRRLENLNTVVEEAVDLALVGARQHGIAASVRLAADIPDVLIDRVQIQQVILNLVRNAVEALHQSERRELHVETRHAGATAEIRVADTGPGIAPEIADRLFRPFTTTKKTGMGVGLSICREIVAAHGGTVWVDPNPGGGSVFSVLLSDVVRESRAADRDRAVATR